MESQKTGNKKCWNFLKVFDYFGVKFSFRINNKPNFQSDFGGLIFLVFLIIALIYFFITFLAFWKRSVYSINYSLTINKPAKEINFTKMEFNLAYSLQYENDTFIDPQKLYFLNQSLVMTKSLDHKKTKDSIPHKNCESKDFFDKIQSNEFNSLNLANFTCSQIKPNSSIQGTYTDNVYKYIELGITINDTMFKSGNLTDLINFFEQNQVKLVVYWLDTTINVTSYEHPVSYYLRTYVTYLDFQTIKKINMDFSIIDFSSDDNAFIQDPITQSKVTFQQSEIFDLGTSNRINMGDVGKTVTKVFMRSSPSSTLIDRSYQKLSQFLANFGGLTSNILFILFLFMTFINQFWAEQKVMNSMLKFREHLIVCYPKQLETIKTNLIRNRDEKNERPGKVSLPSKIDQKNFAVFTEDMDKSIQPNNKPISLEMNEHKEFNTTIDINIENAQRSQILSNYDKRKTLNPEEEMELCQSKQALNYGCCDIILRNFCCKTKSLNFKNILHSKASKKIEYYFDVFTYVRKMQEIDILKYLLLDKDQVNMFNFMSKPSISKDYSDSDEIYQNIQRNRENNPKIYIEELEEMISSYNSIKHKTDDFNKKLFTLFDYEVNHLIDKAKN